MPKLVAKLVKKTKTPSVNASASANANASVASNPSTVDPTPIPAAVVATVFSIAGAIDELSTRYDNVVPPETVSVSIPPELVKDPRIVRQEQIDNELSNGHYAIPSSLRLRLLPDEIYADPEANVCRPFGFDEESVTGLALSISDPQGCGQLQNLTVGPKDKVTGLYPLITGFRRHAAGTRVMNEQLAHGTDRDSCIKLDVLVDPTYSPIRAVDANITENMIHRSLTVVEVANAIAEYKQAHELDDSMASMDLIGSFFDMGRASVIQYYKNVHLAFSNSEKRKLHADAVKYDPILLLAKMTPADRAKLIDQLDTDNYTAELEAIQHEEVSDEAKLKVLEAKRAELALLAEEAEELLDEEQELANKTISKHVNGSAASTHASTPAPTTAPANKLTAKSASPTKSTSTSTSTPTARVSTAPVSQAVKTKKSKEEREAVRAAAKENTKQLELAAKKKEDEAKAARLALKARNAPGKITTTNVIATAKKLGIDAPCKMPSMGMFKKSLEDMVATDDDDKYVFEVTRKQKNFIDRLIECCDGVRSQAELYGYIRQYVDPQD